MAAANPPVQIMQHPPPSTSYSRTIAIETGWCFQISLVWADICIYIYIYVCTYRSGIVTTALIWAQGLWISVNRRPQRRHRMHRPAAGGFRDAFSKGRQKETCKAVAWSVSGLFNKLWGMVGKWPKSWGITYLTWFKNGDT